MVFANDDRSRLGVVPRIFFSAAPDDAPLVAAASEFLGSFPLPILVTRDAVVPGEPWRSRLVGDSSEATHVYVCWSERAGQSPLVADQADRAMGASRVVIPVRLDGTELPRELAPWKCIDARFVAGPNGERYDAGFTDRYVVEGKALLTRLGVPITQILEDPPWPRTPRWRPDGYIETDPRLLAIALYAALR